jgi:pyruvate dehydrogenase E2 component (dihydrolipoamide acetyltransferase)
MKVDLQEVVPSGPGGRIISRDITAYSLSEKVGSGIGGRGFSGLSSAPVTNEDYTEEVPTQIRKVIASAMFKSISEMAQLTHHQSCDATKILALRAEYKVASEETLHSVSINDMVMFALIRTLLKHEYFNATFVDGVIRKYKGAHLSMAVDSPRGLLVPTIFDADKMSLTQLSEKARELADLARSGSINPDLLQPGSFTISNLGAFGVEMFTPIINPPQTAILGVCAITTQVKQESSVISTYPSLGLSLTYDHRVIDGGQAARFALDLKENISNFDAQIKE